MEERDAQELQAAIRHLRTLVGQPVMVTLAFAPAPGHEVLLCRVKLALSQVDLEQEEEESSRLVLAGEITETEDAVLLEEVALPLPEEGWVAAQQVGDETVVQTGDGLVLTAWPLKQP